VIGSTLAHHRIIAATGAGGMGEVDRPRTAGLTGAHAVVGTMASTSPDDRLHEAHRDDPEIGRMLLDLYGW